MNAVRAESQYCIVVILARASETHANCNSGEAHRTANPNPCGLSDNTAKHGAIVEGETLCSSNHL